MKTIRLPILAFTFVFISSGNYFVCSTKLCSEIARRLLSYFGKNLVKLAILFYVNYMLLSNRKNFFSIQRKLCKFKSCKASLCFVWIACSRCHVFFTLDGMIVIQMLANKFLIYSIHDLYDSLPVKYSLK